jgi:hypothetical protein
MIDLIDIENNQSSESENLTESKNKFKSSSLLLIIIPALIILYLFSLLGISIFSFIFKEGISNVSENQSEVNRRNTSYPKIFKKYFTYIINPDGEWEFADRQLFTNPQTHNFQTKLNIFEMLSAEFSNSQSKIVALNRKNPILRENIFNQGKFHFCFL